MESWKSVENDFLFGIGSENKCFFKSSYETLPEDHSYTMY